MSLARVVSASQARDYYYEIDPIAAPDGKGENAEWFGDNIINDFNLVQEGVDRYLDNNDLCKKVSPGRRVRDAEFQALLAGIHPVTGESIIPAGVNDERRAGVDLAFSAPKSVSILALHLKDSDVIEAHRTAVTKALAYVQDNFIQYRETHNGRTATIKCKDMIAATFLHTTSRSNDPQLHTHAVVLNVVKTNDGGYKALSNEEVISYQSVINDVYQNELANGLKELGYKIINYDNKFEVAGISEEVQETFSKRSKEVQECYNSIKDDYPHMTKEEILQIAVRKSRDSKDTKITANELFKQWESEASATEITPIKEEFNHLTDDKILTLAVEDIHRTEATFDSHKLLSSMIKHSRGQKTTEELKAVIEEAVETKKLVQFSTKEERTHYTTKEMIDIERQISVAMKSNIGKSEAYNADFDLYKLTSMTNGQKEFISKIMTSNDKIMLVQGDAGTGKTFAVKTLKEELANANPDIKIIGLGFTGKAAQELSAAAGIETSTITSFLFTNREMDKNSLIIVDEASMVGSRDMHELIKKAGDARIVMVGDIKQLQAISAGRMFSVLQKDNPFVNMSETLRQKTDITKDVVTAIKNYSVGLDRNGLKKAVELLEQNNCLNELKINTSPEEHKDKKKLSQKEKDGSSMLVKMEAIEEYMKAPDNCLLLTTLRAEKDELNKTIRHRIHSSEQLATSKTFTIKEQLPSSRNANSYQPGDKVTKDRKEFTVKDIDMDKNSVTLEYRYKNSQRAMTEVVNLFDKEITAYREKEIDVCVGDKIMFTRNDKKIAVQNGLSGVIEKIDEHNNIFVKTGDKQVIFNIKDYNNIDHAYAVTLHKSQGATCKKGILVHSPDSRLNTQALYVAATRVTNEFKVYTADKEQLIKSSEKAQEKTTTSEIKLERE